METHQKPSLDAGLRTAKPESIASDPVDASGLTGRLQSEPGNIEASSS